VSLGIDQILNCRPSDYEVVSGRSIANVAILLHAMPDPLDETRMTTSTKRERLSTAVLVPLGLFKPQMEVASDQENPSVRRSQPKNTASMIRE
jgi:hypothetical protein